MVEVPVMIVDWVYNCCGSAMSVGDQVDLQLTFYGDIRPADDPVGIELLVGDRLRIVARTIGLVQVGDEFHEGGTVFEVGSIRFASTGTHTSEFVECLGTLEEVRHGFPSAVTTGRVASLQRCDAICEKSGPRSWTVVGYALGEDIKSTEEPTDLEPIVSEAIDLLPPGGGWLAYSPLNGASADETESDRRQVVADLDPEEDHSGWAYRIVLRVD